MKEEKIGEVTVDSGSVVVLDCAVVTEAEGGVDFRCGSLAETIENDWLGTPVNNLQITNNYGAKIAVCVSGFGGDGVYPVFVRRDERGLVTELIVRFRESEA